MPPSSYDGHSLPFILVAVGLVLGLALILSGITITRRPAWSDLGARMTSTGLFLIATAAFFSTEVPTSFAVLIAMLIAGIISSLLWSFAGSLAQPGGLNNEALDTRTIAVVNRSAAMLAAVALILGAAASQLPSTGIGYGKGKAGHFCTLAFILFLLGLPNLSMSLQVIILHWNHLPFHLSARLQNLTRSDRLVYFLILLGFAFAVVVSNGKKFHTL